MALPIGKLTILVGAGIVGSVLAKEGRIPNVSDLVSGAFKIVLKQIRRDDPTPSVSKPHNDSLMAQVNSLRQELQFLASNRSITIVTTSGTGTRRYGIIIVVVVVGYGYIWWKGWKLPDMMFATRRSLSDACGTIAKQLESVYSSIAATRRNLSSRIDNVDKSLDECMDLTTDTQERVSELRGRTDTFGKDIKSVHQAVRTLENKIWSFEEKQDMTNEGVRRLCDYAWNLENGRTSGRIQATPSSSSKPTLEPPPATPSSRTMSLPPALTFEVPSPSSSNGIDQINGTSETYETSSSREVPSVTRGTESTKSGSRASGLSGLTIPGFNAPIFTRTRSATNAVLQQSRSSSLQS